MINPIMKQKINVKSMKKMNRIAFTIQINGINNLYQKDVESSLKNAILSKIHEKMSGK